MITKSYEKPINEIIGLPTEKGAFYEELLWLSKNKKFINKINKLPNEIHAEDVYKLAKRCKLGKTKYRGLLFSAIVSFIQNGNFLEFYKLEPVDSKGIIKPSISLKENNFNRTITLTITLYPDTKMSQVNKLIKNNAQHVKTWQQKIKVKKIKPKSNISRDYKNIYVLARAGVNQTAISESLEKNKNIMEPNSLAKMSSRLQKKIDAAFK